MATQIGVIKQVSGLVVAIDENGAQRVLKAGDALFLGEVIKTSSAASKAVVSMDNGKDVTILGNESVKLDNSVLANSDNTVADVSDLQKALLDGKDLTKLEETAAGGGNAAAGGGDGVSLGAASFEHGGHYSNINENFRNIGDSLRANAISNNEVSGGLSETSAGADRTNQNTFVPKPIITAIMDDVEGYTGDMKDKIFDKEYGKPASNDNTPTLKGTAVANSTVEIFDNGSFIGRTTSNANGEWEFPTPKLTDGDHEFSAQTVNSTGDRSGFSDTTKIEIDTVPGEVNITAIIDNVDGGAKGNIISGTLIDPYDNKEYKKAGLTNDNMPVISGTAEPYAQVEVNILKTDENDVVWTGRIRADKNGNWSIPVDEPLKDGDYSFTAFSIDKAGNQSGIDQVLGVDIDKTAPIVEDLVATPVDTNNPSDGKSDKAIVTGHATDGDKPLVDAPVVVTNEKGEVIGSGKTDSNGDFVIETTKPVNPNDIVKVEVTDKAGNKGEGTTQAGDLEFTDKNVPVVEDLVATPVDTNNPSDGKSDKAIVTGHATDGDKPLVDAPVVVTNEKGEVIGSGKTDSNGDFVIETTKPVNPNDIVKVEVTDKAGNKGEGTTQAGDLEFTDHTAPSAPTVEFIDDTKKPTGTLNKEEVGTDGETKAKISFNPSEVSAGDKVDYTVNGEKQPTHTLTEAEAKQGFITVDVPVKADATSVSVTEVVITDQADNASEPGSKTIDVDTSAPTYKPEISFVDDNDKNGTLNKAEIGNDGKTEAKITVPSNAEVGDSIVYTVNGGQEKTQEITQEIKNNGFKVDVPVTDGQKATVTAKIVDPAGNAGGESEASINVDLTALAIDKIIDDVQGGKFNEDVKGGLTNDNTPTIVGTAKAGTRVEIYDNDVKIGEAVANSNNEWTFTPATSLKDGEHKFIAKANGDSSDAKVTIDATMKIEFSVDLTVSDSSKPGAAGVAPIFAKEQTTNKSDLLILNNGNLTNKTVDLKGGNDDLLVGGRVIGNSVINAGEGNDRINIDVSLGGVAGRGTVNLGDGGNVKVVKTHIHGKTSDANTDYIVKGENGNVIYRGTTDSNGNFGAWLANVVKPGEKITVEMTDKAGNSGQASSKAHAFNSDGSRYYNNELSVGTDMHNGKVTAGDGNDKVVVGTANHGSRYINFGSEIDLGKGDDYLSVYSNITGSKVQMGSGDDIVKTGFDEANNKFTKGDGYITGKSIVDLGDGNNKLYVGTNIANSHVTAGSGDDIVHVGARHEIDPKFKDGYIADKSIVDLGDGNNTLKVETNIDHSRVTTGSGDDIVEVGGYIWNSKDESRSNHPGEADYSINLGDGKNTLTVGAEVKWSSITTGSGSDTIKVGTYVEKSTINLGDGKDTIEAGYFQGNNNNIDGGEGYDRLILTNQADNKGNIDLSNIAKQAHNFEEIDISNGKAGQTLKISLKDVVDLTDDNNILKISGDAGDAVSFKDSGWSKGSSSNGYTSYTNVNTDGKTVTIQIEDEIIRPM
ncbi:retention module-containing protein [Campylobacter concisus]|uniref:retention module-containing protein n=1 Tax=Campylobacter concisus TaxID=199 RepID=UPI000CD7FFED|nr:retention module-containing protein [Campylobacter concisus]